MRASRAVLALLLNLRCLMRRRIACLSMLWWEDALDDKEDFNLSWLDIIPSVVAHSLSTKLSRFSFSLSVKADWDLEIVKAISLSFSLLRIWIFKSGYLIIEVHIYSDSGKHITNFFMWNFFSRVYFWEMVSVSFQPVVLLKQGL